MKIPFLNLKETNAPYEEALKQAAIRVIESGRYLQGEETHDLETEVAHYLGVKHAIAVSNGLDAIRLIFRAYIEEGRLHKDDEIIFPANTYIASLLPLSELGLIPVPVPADPSTHNLDFNRIEEFITPRTKGVLLVHLYGSPCWDREICKKLHDEGLLIIEDNAQAFGASAAERGLGESAKCGALGDAAAISFYPTKNLGALGDAGMVVTSDDILAADVRALANYGSDYRYHNIYRGYNNRMDELHAAMLRVKLPYIDRESEKRQRLAEVYSTHIVHPEVNTPVIIPGAGQVWHQYVITTPHRDALRDWLAANGVATDIHYPAPPHCQPCYKDYFSHPSLKEAEILAKTVLSLPIANITPDDAQKISDLINRFPGE